MSEYTSAFPVRGTICNAIITFSKTRVHSVELVAGRADFSPPASGKTELPSWLESLAERFSLHLTGHPQDFSDVKLDSSGVGEFAQRVYAELREVPPGETISYSALAGRVGASGAARAVARAMAENRFPLVVPCHRVVRADGGMGGFSGAEGVKTKCQLLFAEGVLPVVAARDEVVGSIFEPYLFEIALHSLRTRDRRFDSLVERVGVVQLPREHPDNPFAAITEAICYQQLTGKAAATIFRALSTILHDVVTPDQVLQTDEDEMRKAGLSRAKTAAIRSLAAEVVSNHLDLTMMGRSRFEQVVEVLTRVKGIGLWTAQMFAIFHLGLLDVFPAGDLGIRKAVSQLEKAKSTLAPAEVEKIGEKWRPFRTLATWYLWRSLGTALIGD